MFFITDFQELGRHIEIQKSMTLFCGTLSVLFVAIAVGIFGYLRLDLFQAIVYMMTSWQ